MWSVIFKEEPGFDLSMKLKETFPEEAEDIGNVAGDEFLGANGRILGGEKGKSDVRKHPPKHIHFLDLGAQIVRSGARGGKKIEI